MVQSHSPVPSRTLSPLDVLVKDFKLSPHEYRRVCGEYRLRRYVVRRYYDVVEHEQSQPTIKAASGVEPASGKIP